jgi:glutamyl-Q tRNA(Asp) synthetase
MTSPVFRFAPSPNGYLHLGHAFSALFTFAAARLAGGRFLLRIEDIDAARCPQVLVDAMLEDLAWLGLTWETPVRLQSAHMADYAARLAQLQAMDLTYPCFCSRQDIRRAIPARRDPDGAPVYPGTCRQLSADQRVQRMAQGEPHAIRLDLQRALAQPATAGLQFCEQGAGPGAETGRLAARPELWGDVIVARKDIATSYHLAVVSDDALQGITHVTRGQDLFYATHVHRLLQALLGLAAPVYRHHRLIGDGTGRKLAKSAGDSSLRSLRAAGVSAADICRQLGFEW